MRHLEEDLHLQELLHKVKKKQLMLDAFDASTDEERVVAAILFDKLDVAKQAYKDWIMKLHREQEEGW